MVDWHSPEVIARTAGECLYLYTLSPFGKARKLGRSAFGWLSASRKLHSAKCSSQRSYRDTPQDVESANPPFFILFIRLFNVLFYLL